MRTIISHHCHAHNWFLPLKKGMEERIALRPRWRRKEWVAQQGGRGEDVEFFFLFFDGRGGGGVRALQRGFVW